MNFCGVALGTFIQLVRHFGWNSMYKILADYEQDIKNNINLPQNNQEKIDQSVIRYSKIASRNIKPQFEMFGLPVSADVDLLVENLEPFLPIEEKDPKIFFKELNQ